MALGISVTTFRNMHIHFMSILMNMMCLCIVLAAAGEESEDDESGNKGKSSEKHRDKDTKDQNTGGLSRPDIIGISIGCCLLAGLIAVCICYRRKKHTQS